MEPGLFSTGGIGGGGGVAVSLGECGRGAAEEVYLEQFSRMLWTTVVSNLRRRSDCLVLFQSLVSFPWGEGRVFQNSLHFKRGLMY